MKTNSGKINFVILTVATILGLLFCGACFNLGIYVIDDILTRSVGTGWARAIIISVLVLLIVLTGVWAVCFGKDENDNKDE